MGARAVLPYEGIDATAHAAMGEVVGRGAGERDDSREVRKRGVTSLCVGQTFLSASLWPDRNVWPTHTNKLFAVGKLEQLVCLPLARQECLAHTDNLFWWGKPEQTFLSASLWPDRNVWPTWTTFLLWANRSRHSCLRPSGQTGMSGPHTDNVFGVGKPGQTFLSASLWPDRNVWPIRCATAAPRAPSRARAYASRQRAPESSDRSDSRRSRGRRESRS